MTIQHDLIVLGRGAGGVALIHALARRKWRGRLGWVGQPHSLAFHHARPEHLLNTRAGAMSIDTDNSHGFLAWLHGAGRHTAIDAFVPRRWFGAYLDQCTKDAITRLSETGCEISLSDGEIAHIEPDSGAWRVHGADGAWRAPLLVSAIGFGPQRPPLHHDAHDPWRAPYQLIAARGGRVAIVGAGLSALDAVHSVRQAGHRGSIIMMSRLGAAPMAHADGAFDGAGFAWAPSVAQSLHNLRRAAKTQDWRTLLAGLRTDTPRWWGQIPAAERRRIMHGRRLDLWSLHRHRAPPETIAILDAARTEGALIVRKATVQAITAKKSGFTLKTDAGAITAAWVIDARGPAIDLSCNTLFAPLLAAGFARVSQTGIGLAGDETGLIAQMGPASLWVMGAALFGERLETTAFTELRDQAGVIAEAIIARTRPSV